MTMPNLPIDPKEENVLFSDLIYIERKIVKKLRLSQNAMGYDEAVAALADLEKERKDILYKLAQIPETATVR